MTNLLESPFIRTSFSIEQIAYLDDSARSALNDTIRFDDIIDDELLADCYNRAESFASAPISLFDDTFDINLLYTLICLRIDELAPNPT